MKPNIRIWNIVNNVKKLLKGDIAYSISTQIKLIINFYSIQSTLKLNSFIPSYTLFYAVKNNVYNRGIGRLYN